MELWICFWIRGTVLLDVTFSPYISKKVSTQILRRLFAFSIYVRLLTPGEAYSIQSPQKYAQIQQTPCRFPIATNDP